MAPRIQTQPTDFSGMAAATATGERFTATRSRVRNGSVIDGIPIVFKGDLKEANERFGRAAVESDGPGSSGRQSYRARVGFVTRLAQNGDKILATIQVNPETSEGSQAVWEAENRTDWPPFVLRASGRSLVIDPVVPEGLREDDLQESSDPARRLPVFRFKPRPLAERQAALARFTLPALAVAETLAEDLPSIPPKAASLAQRLKRFVT